MQNHTANGTNQQEQHLPDRLELLQASGGDSSNHSSDAQHHQQEPQQHQQQQQQQREQHSGHSVTPDHNTPQHGYEQQLSVESQEAINALAAKGQAESFIHPDLRHSPEAKDDDITMSMTALPPQNHHHNPGQMGPPAPVPQVLAPAPVGQPGMQDQQHGQHPQHGDDSGRHSPKQKRELSTSKRAAQNRAAQRAFRQRKEGYIKSLEQQIQKARETEENYKILQEEAYQLREYIIHLQSKLLDTQGEFPQPPSHLNVQNRELGVDEDERIVAEQQAQAQAQAQAQGNPTQSHGHAPHNPAGPADNTTPLAAVAQAVAGLAAQEMAAGGAAEVRYPSPGPNDYRTSENRDNIGSGLGSNNDDMRHLSAAASADVDDGREQAQASA